MTTHPLFEKAKLIVKDYLNEELRVISVLQEIEKERVHLLLGYRSMFQCATEGLGLAENQAYLLLGVARKCTQVPELKVAIEEGVISASTAKKILPVIESSNSQHWIAKAQGCTQRDLEREVAKENPDYEIRERMSPVTKNVVEFRCGLTPEEEKLLIRCKELICQKAKKAVTYSQVIKRLAEQFLKQEDPVQKAERAALQAKQVLRPAPQNPRLIPASVRHQVNLRDRGECQYRLPNGKRCLARQWVEKHHIKEQSRGGRHTLENLITLCSAHHTGTHGFARVKWGREGRAGALA